MKKNLTNQVPEFGKNKVNNDIQQREGLRKMGVTYVTLMTDVNI